MKREANRRQLKNYLVVNKFHLKLLVINLIYVLFIFAVIIGEILFPFYQDMFKINDLYAQHYSAKFFIVLLNRLSIALLVILVFIFLYQVMVNHKFCGPLVNFSNTFQKISQGDLTRKIFLRRHDFLKNEAAQVNEMIDSLSDRIMTLKKDHDSLLSALEGMSKVEMVPDEYQDALRTLKKQADICNKHLSQFKIEAISKLPNE
jgi:methyl-accepting chemotaxis protein